MPAITYIRQARRERFAGTAEAARVAAERLRGASDSLLDEMRRLLENHHVTGNVEYLGQEVERHNQLQCMLYGLAKTMDEIAAMQVSDGTPNLPAKIAAARAAAETAATLMRDTVDAKIAQVDVPPVPDTLDEFMFLAPEDPPSPALVTVRAHAKRILEISRGFVLFVDAISPGDMGLEDCLAHVYCVQYMASPMEESPNYAPALTLLMTDWEDVLRAMQDCVKRRLSVLHPGTAVTDAFVVRMRRLSLIQAIENVRAEFRQRIDPEHPNYVYVADDDLPNVRANFNELQGGMVAVLEFLNEREAELALELDTQGIRFAPSGFSAFVPLSVASIETAIDGLFQNWHRAIANVETSDDDDGDDGDNGPPPSPPPPPPLGPCPAVNCNDHALDAEGNPAVCAICFVDLTAQTNDEIDLGGCIRFLNNDDRPCTHVFHRLCASMWLAQKPKCPVCKRYTLCTIP